MNIIIDMITMQKHNQTNTLLPSIVNIRKDIITLSSYKYLEDINEPPFEKEDNPSQ